MDEQAQSKWNNIYADVDINRQSVSRVVEDNGHLLPMQGRALDLACGTGGDAIYLANHGLLVDAWDISDAVIEKLGFYALEKALPINAETHDIKEHPPAENTYDVIVVAHFLDRELMPILIQSLKPGGLIFYQTFSKVVTSTYTGPKNMAFRLDENELLDLFSDLQLIVYREEGLLGDLQRGFRNEIMYIGQKSK